jgi:hypothetical protein
MIINIINIFNINDIGSIGRMIDNNNIRSNNINTLVNRVRSSRLVMDFLTHILYLS